jgi:hypothetical protein
MGEAKAWSPSLWCIARAFVRAEFGPKRDGIWYGWRALKRDRKVDRCERRQGHTALRGSEQFVSDDHSDNRAVFATCRRCGTRLCLWHSQRAAAGECMPTKYLR